MSPDTSPVDDSALRAYWQNRHAHEVYHDSAHDFGDYEPAYRAGYEGFRKHAGRSFDEVRDQLADDYARIKGNSRLAWDKAVHAARAAWHDVERALPGDFDRDGR